MVGWAYVSKRQNFITKETYADFHSIFVSPSQRGTATVGKLCQAVFDYCASQKLDRVVFRTRATNEPMKAVLARVGFVPTQIFYERPITVRKMRRTHASPGRSAIRRGMRWRTTSPDGHSRCTIASIATSGFMSGLHSSVSISSRRCSGHVVSTMCDSARNTAMVRPCGT